MRRLRTLLWPVAVFAAVAVLLGCSRPRTDASADAFGPAVSAYLAEKGTLCVGKTSWPIDVTKRASDIGSRDALQLPVLERLGLVTSTTETVAVPGEEGAPAVPQEVRRYRLTDAGMRYFIEASPGGGRDFCAAKLTLDRVVSFELAGDAGTQATVKYTYHADPFPWVYGDQVERVFPAVARVIRGAGTDQLEETFTRTPKGWVANDLGGGGR
jgi:hypothetical protein